MYIYIYTGSSRGITFGFRLMPLKKGMKLFISKLCIK